MVDQRRFLKRTLIVAFCVAIFYGLQVGFLYQPYRSDLLQRAQEAENGIDTASITRHRLEEFRQFAANQRILLQESRRKVPHHLDVETFRRDFTNWAQEAAVEVELLSRREEQKKFYDQSEIQVRMTGEPSVLDEILTRKDELDRFVVLLSQTSTEKAKDVTLLILAVPPLPDPPAPEPCAAPQRWSGLWPLSSWIREHEKKMVRLCAELEKHGPILEAVRDHHRVLREQEALKSVMQAFEAAER